MPAPSSPEAQRIIDTAIGTPGGLDALLRMLGLPFTGVDLAGVVLAATLAIAVGFVLRGRRSRRATVIVAAHET